MEILTGIVALLCVALMCRFSYLIGRSSGAISVHEENLRDLAK